MFPQSLHLSLLSCEVFTDSMRHVPPCLSAFEASQAHSILPLATCFLGSRTNTNVLCAVILHILEFPCGLCRGTKEAMQAILVFGK